MTPEQHGDKADELYSKAAYGDSVLADVTMGAAHSALWRIGRAYAAAEAALEEAAGTDDAAERRKLAQYAADLAAGLPAVAERH